MTGDDDLKVKSLLGTYFGTNTSMLTISWKTLKISLPKAHTFTIVSYQACSIGTVKGHGNWGFSAWRWDRLHSCDCYLTCEHTYIVEYFRYELHLSSGISVNYISYLNLWGIAGSEDDLMKLMRSSISFIQVQKLADHVFAKIRFGVNEHGQPECCPLNARCLAACSLVRAANGLLCVFACIKLCKAGARATCHCDKRLKVQTLNRMREIDLDRFVIYSSCLLSWFYSFRCHLWLCPDRYKISFSQMHR